MSIFGFILVMIPLSLIGLFVFSVILTPSAKSKSRNYPAPQSHKQESQSTPQTIVYAAPKGEVWTDFRRMLEQPHLLVAGCQGSGKSVTLNGLIDTILYRLPFDRDRGAQMILIDPKCVEFSDYEHLPHTLAYAEGFNPSAWTSAMKKAIDIMESRKAYMKSKRIKTYDKGDLYVFIDEWATVFRSGKKEAYDLMMRLVSEGRAEKVHVVMATQVPTTKIIPSEVRENFDARLCLRTVNTVQSRVIMGEDGCETLPRPADAGRAEGFYCHGGKIEKIVIPYVTQSELDRDVNYWHDQMRQNGIDPLVA